MSRHCEAWIEHDYNPFILFDNNGKIISLNQEAHFLLGGDNQKKIFDIAQTFASMSYGFKTTIIDIELDSHKFYAITVGYEDEDAIGIRLYKSPMKKFTHIEEDGEKVNIYALLDLCISASSTHSNIIFHKKFDPTLPDVYLKVDLFMKLITKIYQSHLTASEITTSLSLITGEHIRFNNKKYPIFSISIKSDKKDASFEKSIEELVSKSHHAVRFEKNETILNIALVT